MSARRRVSRPEASTAPLRADELRAEQGEPEQGGRRGEQEPQAAAPIKNEAETEEAEPGEGQEEGGTLIAVDAARRNGSQTVRIPITKAAIR